MAAAGIINAIGIGSAVLTTVGFLQANVPGSAPPEGATVKIKAGLPGLKDEAASLGGSIDKIYAFDERNGYGGQTDGCKIESGGTCEKTVDQDVPGRRGGYISVSNNNDATCIAWITVKQDDETKGGIWTGDIGYGCGQAWYNSVEPAGQLEEKDWYEADGKTQKEYVPKCTWIDADHTNDIANAALKFDVGAYQSEAVEDTFGRDAQCSATIYGSDSGPIAGQPGKRDSAPIHKRSRPTWMTDNLIMSNHTSQPAEQLCSSETSWGPDFIGPDGNFCDMDSKTLMPLCSLQDVDGCVDVDEGAGQIIKKRTIARRSANVVHKSYGKISKWGGQ